MIKEENSIRIMFVGDISLGEYYTSFGHGPRSYSCNRNPFEKIQPILDQADFVVGNLEAAITNNNLKKGEPESMVLRADPDHAKLLAEAGFKFLQVSNNHTVQHGSKGFDETVSILDSLKISAVGLSNQEVLVIERLGQKIGFLAASDVPDNTNINQTSYQRLNNEFKERVRESVTKVDHLFVMLHWGLESSTSPLDYQRAYASELAQLGVRALIGQHPHLFYEIWREHDTIIAPSLGDFIFDLGWDQRYLKTGILDIELNNNKVTAKVWPVHILNNGCTPSPNGAPIVLKSHINLYDLGSSMNGEQQRKLIYFIKNIHKGNTYLKLKFFIRKAIPIKRNRIGNE